MRTSVLGVPGYTRATAVSILDARGALVIFDILTFSSPSALDLRHAYCTTSDATLTTEKTVVAAKWRCVTGHTQDR